MVRMGNSTLLIVDDDSSTCETLSDIFELNNFIVSTAATGKEATDFITNNSVDVVLLDIRLPDVDGVDLMTQLREINQELIFIFMTGFASVEYTKKAFEKGAYSFFVKPVLIEEALHVIREALEKKLLEKEYRRAELERNQALAEYEDLYNSAPDMYASIDSNTGMIVKCNDTLLTNLGFTEDEIIGKHYLDLYHSESVENVEQKIWPTLLSTGAVKNRELLLQCKNGNKIPVTLNGAIAKDSLGRSFQVRKVWHDLTDRKKLEEQLLVSEKMTTIAGLAAGVAHEINTPLSGILQSIQLVEMGLDPDNESNVNDANKHGVDLEKLSDYLKEKELDFFLSGIRESAVVAARIVSDLLQFSRPHESEWTSTDLRMVIKRAIGLAKADYTLKKEYNIHNVEFIDDFDPEVPEVKCMAMEVEQVLINLIKNSCQAMIDGKVSRESPKITHKTYVENDFAVVEVIDNGPGIAGDIVHHIFDPFFTTKEVGVGTGLGLSVSYSIICVKHEGDIRVESVPNEATRFIIRLPIKVERK